MSEPFRHDLAHLTMILPKQVTAEQGPGGVYGLQLTIYVPIHVMPSILSVTKAAVEAWLVDENRRKMEEAAP